MTRASLTRKRRWPRCAAATDTLHCELPCLLCVLCGCVDCVGGGVVRKEDELS